MKSMKLIKALILIYIVVVGVEAISDTINVDNLTPGSVAGNIMASQGVTFTSGAVNSDAVSVGDTIRLTFSPVPLPSAAWLFSIGLGALWITARRHMPRS